MNPIARCPASSRNAVISRAAASSSIVTTGDAWARSSGAMRTNGTPRASSAAMRSWLADKGGVIIVDSLDSCLREAGEVIQAGLKPKHLVEIGELIMVKKAAMREVELGGEGEKGLIEWLTRGNVIYKSVGLGLMDLIVGEDLVGLAQTRGIGTTVDNF